MWRYDQLKGIYRHLSAREGSDPYLDELERSVKVALEAQKSQVEDVRQAWSFLLEVEHYLASVPRPELEPSPTAPPPGSEAVREKLGSTLGDSEKTLVLQAGDCCGSGMLCQKPGCQVSCTATILLGCLVII